MNLHNVLYEVNNNIYIKLDTSSGEYDDDESLGKIIQIQRSGLQPTVKI